MNSNIDETSGVVASGPALAAPSCFGISATISGTPGADVLRGTPGPDVIVGGGGNDTIRGLGGDDRICGGAGADVLAGGSGGDWVDGGALEDSIRGGPSDLRIEHHSLLGNDNLFGGPGDDSIWSGRGPIDFLYGETGNDTLTGAPNQQLLSGGPGNDVLSGSTGQDELWGGPGADHLGGAGGRFDLALYFTNGGRLSVNLATQHADGEGRDSLSGVEAAFAFGNSDDHLTGNGRRNFFVSGDVTLNALAEIYGLTVAESAAALSLADFFAEELRRTPRQGGGNRAAGRAFRNHVTAFSNVAHRRPDVLERERDLGACHSDPVVAPAAHDLAGHGPRREHRAEQLLFDPEPLAVGSLDQKFEHTITLPLLAARLRSALSRGRDRPGPTPRAARA